MMDVFWIFFLFLIGACVGSFANVIVYRMPRGLSIAFPPSHCPSCGRAIKWRDNIPLLSWLFLRGRCRFCKVSISPRYILVEAAAAALVAGLYVCYFVLDIRDNAGRFEQVWPMFLAHAALLCGLLVCTIIDIDHWIVQLEVCWVVSLVGLVAATAWPHPWMPQISTTTGAMSLAAAVGLALSMVMQRYGLIRRSFIDVDDRPIDAPKGGQAGKDTAPPSVAVTASSGVNPRKEILREVLFLAPAVALAYAAYLAVSSVSAVSEPWNRLMSGPAGRHINGFLAALFGYLVGGALIWGIRILGTLAFGKEAMGLGDVHILAAVGAVTGWVVPTIACFVAPVIGLLWAIHLWLTKKQRELPYGPWLAAGTIAVMLFYDFFAELLAPYAEVFAAAPK